MLMSKRSITLCILAGAIVLTGAMLDVVVRVKRKKTRADLDRQLLQWEGEGGNPVPEGTAATPSSKAESSAST
jgi:hypothetical protein